MFNRISIPTEVYSLNSLNHDELKELYALKSFKGLDYYTAYYILSAVYNPGKVVETSVSTEDIETLKKEIEELYEYHGTEHVIFAKEEESKEVEGMFWFYPYSRKKIIKVYPLKKEENNIKGIFVFGEDKTGCITLQFKNVAKYGMSKNDFMRIS